MLSRGWVRGSLNGVLAFLASLWLALSLAGCKCPCSGSGAAAARDGVFIHLSKGEEDPHAVVMALKMADLMSADRDVLVYFDLKGINVLMKDGKDISFQGFDGSRAQIQTLLGKGVPLYACPGCLKALGKAPEDLLGGVKVAEKEAFFSFAKGRILSLDY